MKSKKGGPSKISKAPTEQTPINNLTNAQQQMASNQQQQTQVPVQNSFVAQQLLNNNGPQVQSVSQGANLFGSPVQQMQVPNQYAQFPPQQFFQQNTVQQVQGPVWGRRANLSNQAPKHPEVFNDD